MEKLPDELQCIIFSFVVVTELCPLSKTTSKVMVSNVVWKPLTVFRFGNIESNNYFREYCWQLKLKRHQNRYKRQWTLGCVGKIYPLEKDVWPPAVF